MIDSNDDYSRRFQELRPFLVNDEGLRYADFIKALTPNYTRLYLDIALGYFALIVTFAFVRAVPVEMDYGLLFIVFAGAISIGFWIAYLQLFLHEGAHFNFAPDRGQSDFLCNILVAWMIGTSVQQYRITHFQHHRALGKIDDSESTYFSSLRYGPRLSVWDVALARPIRESAAFGPD
ncbi:fatty acid desaturase [Bradyrhizobium liaoningense]|uniref:fatty acid desaturase n=1 Tax=Bradyrhizobium liaoningense TaxID=43992 RepID=UPI001BAACE55|nr:fatty acid desaturase [Bradyrhizobium liaoningense]MBR1071131.1 fatty acid desaturase [Bradyrhizobium liaoningense]